jgi:hypothetical protein
VGERDESFNEKERDKKIVGDGNLVCSALKCGV